MTAKEEGSFTIPILLSLLIANPVVLFLLFNSLLWALLLFFLASAATFLSYRTRTRWYSVYVLNALVVLSLFLHFELAFRFGFSDYVIEDLYDLRGSVYFNKPNLSRTLTDKEFSVLYATNVQGFRIDESMDRERRVESCDWLFIGDSYTQGAQVNFMDLYTSKLYEEFPDKVIVNAGISGFGIAEELEFYKVHGRKLRPRKVFLQLCSFNDFMNVELKEYGLTDRLMQHSDLARSVLYGLKYKSPGELPLGRWTEPFYPTEKDNITYNVFYRQSDERKKRDLTNFESLLKEFSVETRKDGAELIVFLIPTKEQIYYHDFAEVLDNFRIDPTKVDMSIPNRLLRRIADSLDIALIDLKESLSLHQGRVLFEYDEHLNAEGHKALAQLLATHLDAERSGVRLLSTSFYGDRYPSYFEDGNSILFQSFRDGNTELFIADSAFRQQRRLTTNNVDESHPFANQDERLIAFTSGDAATMRTRVEIMDMNGTERKMITAQPNQFSAIPAFSKDNQNIAFAEWFLDERTKQFSQPIIAVADLFGAVLLRIATDNSESWRPIFARGDSSVIYISKRGGNFDLYQYFLHEKTEHRLTNTPYDEWDPQISPDGKRIVHAGHKEGNWDLFELELPTSHSKQLTRTIGEEWDPHYSPDGTHILYAGEYGLFRGIYKMQLNTKN